MSNAFFTDSIDTILFPITGIKEKSEFPKFVTRIEVDDSKYSSNLKTKFEYFEKVIAPPLGKLNSTRNNINGYPGFEIEYTDNDGTIHIASVEMNAKIYTFFSILGLNDTQYLHDLRQIISTLKPNQFKNVDITKANYKFVNETTIVDAIEKVRQQYIFTNLISKEYFNDAFNFTMSYKSFGDDSINSIDKKALQTFDNRIRIELPQVKITNYKPPYITISKTDPYVFKQMKLLNNFMLSWGVIDPNLDKPSQELLIMERFGVKAPNRHNIYSEFFKVADPYENKTGLLSEYKYYDPIYSEIVHRKSVSFITHNDDHISFTLTARQPDFALYAPLFDTMMLSLKFH